jgi:transposase
MYLGIDTHAEYSQVAVVDADGTLLEELRLPNDRLGDLAEQYAGEEATIEATGHYRPIYDRLDEHLDVTLVDPG